MNYGCFTGADYFRRSDPGLAAHHTIAAAPSAACSSVADLHYSQTRCADF